MGFSETSDCESLLALTPPLPHPQATLVLKNPSCNRVRRASLDYTPACHSPTPASPINSAQIESVPAILDLGPVGSPGLP